MRYGTVIQRIMVKLSAERQKRILLEDVNRSLTHKINQLEDDLKEKKYRPLYWY